MTRGDPSGPNLHLEKVLRAPRAHVFAAFVDEGALAAVAALLARSERTRTIKSLRRPLDSG